MGSDAELAFLVHHALPPRADRNGRAGAEAFARSGQGTVCATELRFICFRKVDGCACQQSRHKTVTCRRGRCKIFKRRRESSRGSGYNPKFRGELTRLNVSALNQRRAPAQESRKAATECSRSVRVLCHNL